MALRHWPPIRASSLAVITPRPHIGHEYPLVRLSTSAPHTTDLKHKSSKVAPIRFVGHDCSSNRSETAHAALSTLAEAAAVQNGFSAGFLKIHDYLRSESEGVETGQSEKLSANVTNNIQKKAVHEPKIRLNLEQIRSSVGDLFGARPRSAGDAFCARLIATRAFSMEFAISSLKMLSVRELGPLTLREVAARSVTASEFLMHVQTLRLEGISCGKSAFARALRTLAQDAQPWLWHGLVDSDRHPDTYDDTELQQALFKSAITKNRTRDAHIILATMAASGHEIDSSVWNELLLAYCFQLEEYCVEQLLQDMLTRKVHVLDETLRAIRDTFLPHQHRPQQVSATVSRPKRNSRAVDGLLFVTELQMSVLRAGQYFRPSHWSEILKRLAKSGRFEVMSRLCIGLASYYELNSDADNGETKRLVSETPFGTKMQREVITWAFNDYEMAVKRTWNGSGSLPPEDYVRGLALLCHLRSTFGVELDEEVIAREMRRGLQQLPELRKKLTRPAGESDTG